MFHRPPFKAREPRSSLETGNKMIHDVARVSVFVVLLIVFQAAVARLPTSREPKRRLQHAATGHALVVLSHRLPKSIYIFLLAVGACLLWYLCTFQEPVFVRMVGPILRPEEKGRQKLPFSFFFLLGTIAVFLFFPADTARYAVECLSFADPCAAFVGQSIESPTLSKSASLAGSIACFLTAWVIGFFMIRQDHTLLGITVGALFCTLSEAAVVTDRLNDNFTIPIFTALAVKLVR